MNSIWKKSTFGKRILVMLLSLLMIVDTLPASAAEMSSLPVETKQTEKTEQNAQTLDVSEEKKTDETDTQEKDTDKTDEINLEESDLDAVQNIQTNNEQTEKLSVKSDKPDIEFSYTVTNSETGEKENAQEANLHVGDKITISSNFQESKMYDTFEDGIGVFATYLCTGTSVSMESSKGLKDNAAARYYWEAYYQDAEGYEDYGVDEKYYAFSYMDGDTLEVYYPMMECVKGGYDGISVFDSNDICLDTVGLEVQPDFSLQYEGKDIYLNQGVDSEPNMISYGNAENGQLRFNILADGEKIDGWSNLYYDFQIENYTGMNSEDEYTLTDAISCQYDDENGAYVLIDGSKIKDKNGGAYALDKCYGLYFTITAGLMGGKVVSLPVELSNSQLTIWDNEGNRIPSSDAVEIDMAKQRIAVYPSCWDEGTEVSLTSSKESVAKVYGNERVALLGLGTARITAKYQYKGKQYTSSVDLTVTSADVMHFVRVQDDEETADEMINDGDIIQIEQGDKIRIGTDVRAKLLSKVSVAASNKDVVDINGTISENFEELGDDFACQNQDIYLTGENVGTSTVTAKATYKGKNYTYTFTVEVVEPKGIYIKQVDRGNNGQVYFWNGKVNSIYMNASDHLGEYAIFETVDGKSQLVNKDDSVKITFTDSNGQDASNYFDVVDVDLDGMTGFYITPRVYNTAFDMTVTKGEDSVKVKIVLSPYRHTLGVYSDEELTDAISMVKMPRVKGSSQDVYFALSTDSALKDVKFQNTSGLEIKSERLGGWTVKTTITYNGDEQYWGGSIQAVIDSQSYDFVDVELEDTVGSDLPYVSAKQIKDFYDAQDDSADIEGGVRLDNFEIALKTIEGKKNLILVRFLGSKESLHYYYLPSELKAEKNVDYFLGSCVTVSIPVAGIENQLFEEYQPNYVYMPDTYTYFGAEEGKGYLAADSTKITYFYMVHRQQADEWVDVDYNQTKDVYSYQGMLFKKTDNTYSCIETGNRNFATAAVNDVHMYPKRQNQEYDLEIYTKPGVEKYLLNKNYLLDAAGEKTLINVKQTDSYNYILSLDSQQLDLLSGEYYLSLTPVVNIGEEKAQLSEVLVPVVVITDNEPPVVEADSQITFNSYYRGGKDIKPDTSVSQPLNIENSYGTAIISVQIASASSTKNEWNAPECYGLSTRQNDDGDWELVWGGDSEQNSIPAKGLELNMEYTVDGYAEVINQTITVKTVNVQPVMTPSETKFTFSDYPYSDAPKTIEFSYSNMSEDQIDWDETFKTIAVTAPKGGSTSDVFLATNENGDCSVGVKNTAVSGTYKLTLEPCVGTVGTEKLTAKPFTLTIVVNGKKPAIKFNGTASVTLNSNYYNTTQNLPAISFTEGDYQVVNTEDAKVIIEMQSSPKNAVKDAVFIKAVNEEGTELTDELYAIEDITLKAGVTAEAVAGNYTFLITVPVKVGEEVVSLTTQASVVVNATRPNYKLSKTALELDAAYPEGTSAKSVDFTQLLLEEGVQLEDLVDKTVSSYQLGQCLDVDVSESGKITMCVKKAGLSAGTYTFTFTPLVKAAGGESVKAAPVKLTLKVTNSSNITLTSKGTSMTVNPYVGQADTMMNFTAKNENVNGAVESYIIQPVNELSGEDATFTLSVTDDSINVENAENAKEGTYRYNIVKKYVQKDGRITYSKPLAYSIVVKKSALTLKTDKTALTIYRDYSKKVSLKDGVEVADGTEESVEYYKLTVPVYFAETDKTVSDCVTEITNNSKNGVISTIENSNVNVYVPIDAKTVGSLALTPVSDTIKCKAVNVKVAFNNTEISKLSTAFETSNVVMNLFETSKVDNVLKSLDGVELTDIRVDSITDSKRVEVKDKFDTAYTDGRLALTLTEKLSDGKYTIKATPYMTVNGEEKALKQASFKLQIVHQGVTLSTDANAEQNLYPELEEVETDTIQILAEIGEKVVDADDITLKVVKTSGNATIDVNTETLARNEFKFVVDASTTKFGINKYNVEVSIEDELGNSVLAGTIKNALTVNVKRVPDKVKLNTAKVTIAPNVQNYVTLNIANEELNRLVSEKEYQYTIDVKETDKKKTLLDESEKNKLLEISTFDNIVKISADNKVEDNGIYYYQADVSLEKNGSIQKTYASVYFTVDVKNTKPVAELQTTAYTFDNAYVDQNLSTYLSIGTELWNLEGVEYQILQGKKDCTDLFEVATDKTIVDGMKGVGLTISLRNTDDDGKVIVVPKGTYIINVVSKIKNASDEVLTLSPVKFTAKVISNRPKVTVKNANFKVNTYTNEEVQTQLTVSDGRNVDSSIIKNISAPKGVTDAADMVHVNLDTDGVLSVYADSDAIKGSYKFSVQPIVKNADGNKVLLDAVTITANVDSKVPTVKFSKTVITANTEFASTADSFARLYADGLSVPYELSAELATTETKPANVEIANILLEHMSIATDSETGNAVVKLSLPTDETLDKVKNGTYKFKITPELYVGSKLQNKETEDPYSLNAINFTVKVENTLPKVSVKSNESIDMNRPTVSGITYTASMSKSDYDSIENITDVELEGEYADFFYVDTEETDMTGGKWVVKYDPSVAENNSKVVVEAGKSYKMNLVATSHTEHKYVTPITVKTIVGNYNVSAQEAFLNTTVGNTRVTLEKTEGVKLSGLPNAKIIKITSDKQGKKVIPNAIDELELQSVENDSANATIAYAYLMMQATKFSNVKSGDTIYVSIMVYPEGNINSKSAKTVMIPVQVK